MKCLEGRQAPLVSVQGLSLRPDCLTGYEIELDYSSESENLPGWRFFVLEFVFSICRLWYAVCHYPFKKFPLQIPTISFHMVRKWVSISLYVRYGSHIFDDCSQKKKFKWISPLNSILNSVSMENVNFALFSFPKTFDCCHFF